MSALRSYDSLDGSQPTGLGDDDRAQQGDRPSPRPRPPGGPKGATCPRSRRRHAPSGDPELWAAVAELPDKQRTAVALRFAADLRYREVAAAMETTEEAARRNVHEGLRKLRERVSERGAADEPDATRWSDCSSSPARTGAARRRRRRPALRRAGRRRGRRPDRLLHASTPRSGSPPSPRRRAAWSRLGLPNVALDDFMAASAELISPQHRRGARDPRDARAGSSTSTSPAAARRSTCLSTGGSSRAASTARCCARPRACRSAITATYGEIAAKAGNARAHRAAGTALGQNPLPIVVPCHRIIRSGGDPGNYGGGPELKRWLLDARGLARGASPQ